MGLILVDGVYFWVDGVDSIEEAEPKTTDEPIEQRQKFIVHTS